jgi:hypothetical protein
VDAANAFVSVGNTTHFGTLTATCTFTNGLMRSNDLRIDTGTMPITGAGVADLRTHAVDYRVSLQLEGDVSVPIQISGTWDNPSYRPDLAAMLAQTPANAIAILNPPAAMSAEASKAGARASEMSARVPLARSRGFSANNAPAAGRYCPGIPRLSERQLWRRTKPFWAGLEQIVGFTAHSCQCEIATRPAAVVKGFGRRPLPQTGMHRAVVGKLCASSSANW